MDSFLINYLKSGKAWVLIGSGPSTEMGYPSWARLAAVAFETVRREGTNEHLNRLEPALKRSDFPQVFEEAKASLGGPRLIQALHQNLVPSRQGEIYRLIARWPVSVYLTTNYDDEIQNHLANLREAYISYSNSEDHLSMLLPDLNGAIVKLHGDLRSEEGLVLTTRQYHEIAEGNAWRYWRTKMTSVFQMTRMVVIGHSLTDNNIRHVLEAAKEGAGVHQPICWIAPDVPTAQIREFLEKFRIRVISYDNRDGEHKNLFRLIENITEFVPPRTSVRIQDQIEKCLVSPLGNNAAAPGFFVFNKLAGQADYEEKRVDILIAAIQSTLPNLSSHTGFNLKAALELAGWPTDLPLPMELSEKVCAKAVEQGLLVRIGDQFKVGPDADELTAQNKSRFQHVRERFKQSLKLRLKRTYPALTNSDIEMIASDIETSLTGYFKEGGLSLATTLLSTGHQFRQSAVPSSILKFISEASARYEDLLKRQAFCTVSVDAFVKAESAERDYLGRISQGFFALHLLGAFGDVAIEKLKQAKQTIWLVDSSAQIPALALGAPTHPAFRDCFLRLFRTGIRFLTTERLFDETREHLWFANNVIREFGPESSAVIAGATGQPPYRKSNQFLEGFIRWRSAGNPSDWGSYLFQIFKSENPRPADIENALLEIGIEVIALDIWPGFKQEDLNVRDEYAEKIMRAREGSASVTETPESVQASEPWKKSQPEAEAFLIIKKEREGSYHILSDPGVSSLCWFISQTSILNTIEQGIRITWQPEAFLRFASTLFPAADPESSDHAFEALLWGLAQSGATLLDEDTVARVFGGVIDQATLSIAEQLKIYEENIAKKYGESSEKVLAKVPPSYRPLAAIQLANEMLQVQEKELQHAKDSLTVITKGKQLAEQKLREVESFRRKMEAKRDRGQRKNRKQKAKARHKK